MTTEYDYTPDVNDTVGTDSFSGFNFPYENWSKLPHAFIEQLPSIRTVAEIKVLLYVLRHTWGYQDFEDGRRITLDEFCHGRKRRDGSRIDPGIGLSPNAVKAGVRAAVAHGFLIRESDGRDAARAAHVYCLRMAEGDTAGGQTLTINEGPRYQTLTPDEGEGYQTLIPPGSNFDMPSEKETEKETRSERKKHVPSEKVAADGAAADGAAEDGGGDFDDLFPPRTAPVDLPLPFEVPAGMSAADYVRQRGMAAHAAAMARDAAITHGAAPDIWEANRFVRAWLDAHPADPHGEIVALGQDLEARLGMRPDWAAKVEVVNWLSGLKKALRAADGDGQLVVSVAQDMREQGLAIPQPYSLVKMVMDAAACARTRRTSPPDEGAGITWLD